MKPFTKQLILFDINNLDPDAKLFLLATGLMNNIQISEAINNFVLELKENNLWNTFLCIYPLVGGTSTTHKYNLKDPRDLDAAYRLTFSGGYTHNSNGITGNGVNSNTNTNLNANVTQINNTSLSVYSKTTGANAGTEIGLSVGAASPRLNLMIHYTSNNTYFDINNAYLGTAVALATTATGLYISSRTASNVIKLYRRGTAVSTQADASTTQNTTPIYFGVLAGGGYTSRNTCFYSIGSGLTDTQAAQLNEAVQNLQTALGRNAY